MTDNERSVNERAATLEQPASLSAPRDLAIGAEALFRDHAQFVARFLAHLRVPDRDIEDHLQEVFLVAHKKGGFLPQGARPTTWLARIAMNVAGTRGRARRRRQEDASDHLDEMPSWETTPETRAGTIEALVRVQRALDVLDLEQRTLFVLYEIEGEACADIAAGLGVPVGTVYSRLHAARAAFTAEYERSFAPLATKKETP